MTRRRRVLRAAVVIGVVLITAPLLVLAALVAGAALECWRYR